jgi:hypothetical protein
MRFRLFNPDTEFRDEPAPAAAFRREELREILCARADGFSADAGQTILRGRLFRERDHGSLDLRNDVGWGAGADNHAEKVDTS